MPVLEADRPFVVGPPLASRLADHLHPHPLDPDQDVDDDLVDADVPPTPHQLALRRRLAAGDTNRRLRLLAGLLQVAADVCERTDAAGWPAGKAAALRHDLAGLSWLLDHAAGVAGGLVLGGAGDAAAGDTHADDLRSLLVLADTL